VDRQRALVQRPRPGEVALGVKQAGEVVERVCRPGILGAECLSWIASAATKWETVAERLTLPAPKPDEKPMSWWLWLRSTR
jgi:hypothetical protein